MLATLERFLGKFAQYKQLTISYRKFQTANILVPFNQYFIKDIRECSYVASLRTVLGLAFALLRHC